MLGGAMRTDGTSQRRQRISMLAAIALLTFIGLAAAPGPSAAVPADEYTRARVETVERIEARQIAGTDHLHQWVQARLRDGRVVTAEYSIPLAQGRGQLLRVGDLVVVTRGAQTTGTYEVADRYRLPSLGWILALFLAAVVATTRIRGATSVLGLAVSVLVLARFVVPQIIAGRPPVLISLLGALAIGVVSIYLAHGFSRRTSVALAGTLVTLGLAAATAAISVRLAGLTGAASEEAFYLQLGPLEALNLRGLLLGGIILGALGVLDDVTTAQAATVEELSRANPALPTRELYRRGLSVGREHITALVNTLVLAYAGASLPLFVLFAVDIPAPLWVTLNSELVAEEIVRALIGSLALVLAVPITTALAARLLRARA
jgi:uncharacterized membrane protein